MPIFLKTFFIWLLNLLEKRKHGLIQTLTLAGCALLCSWILQNAQGLGLIVVDIVLALCVVLNITIAIIASHSYNYIPNPAAEPLHEQAAKQEAVWLHSNFAWQAVNIGMTLIPLYCTCVAIYFSGTPINGVWDHTRVLFYSILSLVLSLSVYVIQPQKRAAGYLKAHEIIHTALLEYELKNDKAILADALIRGTKHVSRQNP